MDSIRPLDAINAGKLLKVTEIFVSIQGEGPLAGRVATFVRLSGCNLACPNCDTQKQSPPREMTEIEILAEIEAKAKTPLVVITGGEPFFQDIAQLLFHLVQKYMVQIETNGTLGSEKIARICRAAMYPPTIVCSPKVDKTGAVKIHPKIEPLIKHYKIVIDSMAMNHEKGTPTAILGSKITTKEGFRYPKVATPRIFLQPEMSITPDTPFDWDHENVRCVRKLCLRFGFSMSIQLHKFLGIK